MAIQSSKRRVKCDEKQPSCFKCTSTGRICDGYVQSEKDYQIQVFSYAQKLSSTPKNAIPVLSGFGDNVRSLEFYYHCVGPMLSGRFDTKFWSRIVLQMAHSEPAVRSALIALGYLNEHETGSLEYARRSADSKDGYERKTFWLHYNKAIRYLVHRMVQPSYTPEVGLVTCILFVCIEYLQADSHTAFAHVRNGLKIVSELRQNHKAGSLTHKAGLTQNSSSMPMDMIEKILVPILTQGLVSAFVYGVNVEAEFAFLETPPQHLKMYRFTSVREALSSYWDLRNASILLARDMTMKLFQAIPPTASDFQRQEHVLECHRTWLKALTALEDSQEFSKEESIDISALKLAYYSSYTACACVIDTRQMAYDAHLHSFKMLLLHANLVVNSTGLLSASRTQTPCRVAAANFTFDTSLIPALYYTALRCRCPTTRREAVSLLSLGLPREGLWDAEQHRIVAERVIEIEETEVDGRGWPVERTRVWSSAVGTNLDENSRFRVSFLLARDLGMGGEKAWSEWYVLGDGKRKSLM
ncbi:hypothetical protein P153DRAFT_382549 [Dothidotthia symphoricarpi CBS 119687]|uniref:Zn(2)-C6 fungal-type domain-containing protein n=1 Tax=Dothidotthia symphoricarpi CBS 119687 TaxID=1392245 RepID=A0A6A6AMY4_9PLEO|nr:uncharacterized protein P153DRAFT_382549 [Dothidotthia symphoricarpi CBS 119687]KAF2132926.1 hypothetical protein P153DRAFT_382549 [Dothidotthia symphoricarpi CBS 119687]